MSDLIERLRIAQANANTKEGMELAAECIEEILVWRNRHETLENERDEMAQAFAQSVHWIGECLKVRSIRCQEWNGEAIMWKTEHDQMQRKFKQGKRPNDDLPI